MSEVLPVLGVRHFEYIAVRTPGDDDFLRELKTAARDADIPAIWISPEQASFMQILLKSCGARRVLEIGTLAGYSAIAMARALPADGQVRTIEVDPRYVRFAREWIARSNVAGLVQVVEGEGLSVLRLLPAESLDAIFIDADKQGYAAYLMQARRLLRPGGLVLADNALCFGLLFDANPKDPEVAPLRRFNDLMGQDECFHSVIVPLGDGLWVGVKR